MINQTSVDAVRASRVSDRQVRPLYDSYCFSRIPGSICHWLTGDDALSDRALPTDVLNGLPERYDKVILVLIDAFGWAFLEPLLTSNPFLKRFADHGKVSMLTSQFPSTTSAHMTTLHTGKSVGETGVFEWFYYEPVLDRVIAPLLYSLAADGQRDSLHREDAPPDKLYPTTSIYQTLDMRGVRRFAYLERQIAYSVYTETMLKGSTMLPYLSYSEGFTNLANSVTRDSEPAFHFLYISIVDTLLHMYGPHAPQVQAEISTILHALEESLHANLDGKAKRTLLLLTADHGQIDNDLGQIVYLDRSDPGLADLLRHDRRGQPIVPGGSSRDMFLYVKPDRIAEVQQRLANLLGDKAEIRVTADLIAEGYFGTRTPSPEFIGRVSELVILPRPGQLVYWFGDGRYEQKYRGMHGGLTPEEMEIPFLALSYP